MKKILTSLTIVGLLASFVLPQAQAATDEQWYKSGPPTTEPSWGIAMVEDTGDQSPQSYLLSVKAEEYVTDRGKVLGVKSCKNYTDAE